MKTSNVDETGEIADVPASPLLCIARGNRYGSVPGLDDEELAEPWELERHVLLEEWGPVLALPVRRQRCSIRPHFDEAFGVDWGAFATVDFDRISGGFDKTRYRIDKLKEELRNVIIMIQIVGARLPRVRYSVLKYLRLGIIDLDHIQSPDMRALAKYYLRARRLQKMIRELKDAAGAKVEQELTEESQ